MKIQMKINFKFLIFFGIVWQAAWVIMLAKYEIREWILTTGIFGPSCQGCIEQTMGSLFIAMIPLIVGSSITGYGVVKLMKFSKRTNFVLVFLAVSISLLLISFLLFGLINFSLNFAS